MGHYDSCREGYCGCGQALDTGGNCYSNCGRQNYSPATAPLKGEREDMGMEELPNVHLSDKAIADHRERRITASQMPTAEDLKDPWVTVVWFDMDKSYDLQVTHMRASEVEAFEFHNGGTSKYVVLRGKNEEVKVKPNGYVLETKK